jgi:hypothetical protein
MSTNEPPIRSAIRRSHVKPSSKEAAFREIHALLDEQIHTLRQEHKLTDEETIQYGERAARIKLLFDSIDSHSEANQSNCRVTISDGEISPS